jgi:hypothetical protein
MRVNCISGFYKFYPENSLEIARAKEVFGIELVACEDFYTFAALRDMKNYSVIGYPIGLGLGKKHYAGQKWSVLKENLLVYNLILGNITELALSVRVYTVPYEPGKYVTFTAIPQAGGFINGVPFISFNGMIDFETNAIYVRDIGTW